MLNEVNFSPDDKEFEMRRTIEVWILDDNVDFSESLMRGWGMAGDSFGFQAYPTAREALAEIENKIQINQTLPSIIFVDGNLDKDEGELKNGANFIIKVRQLEIPQPTLIAHSNSKSSNEEMMSAGADLAMEKGPATRLKDYLAYFQSLENRRGVE